MLMHIVLDTDGISAAILELEDAAQGHPDGFPFSAIADQALVQVISTNGPISDPREHLLRAANWLRSQRPASQTQRSRGLL
jgi:hypothetical protein